MTLNKAQQKGNTTEVLSEISDLLAPGLVYAHTRINDNTQKTLQSTSFLYALIELLDEKGLITIEALDERKKEVAERLVRKFKESGVGLMYQDPEYDKYNFAHEAKIDCDSRLHICKAICCAIPFALSRQDVKEGVIRWDFGRPYLIAHDRDGYCAHLNRNTYRCSVHAKRTVPCRGFDCRNNEKWNIWRDYDQKIINPDLSEQVKHSNLKAYGMKQKPPKVG